jgi:hypothetical protein
MPYALVILGFLIFPTPSVEAFYDEARQVGLYERSIGEVEDPVLKFTQGVLVRDPVLTKKDIDGIMANRSDVVCSQREEDGANCAALTGDVQHVVNREASVRAFGRDLQMIATGYEATLGEHPGQHAAIPPRLSSIISVWQASNDWLITPIQEQRVRAVPMPDEVTDGDDSPLMELITALNAIRDVDYDAWIAAVWQYRYGLKTVQRTSEKPCVVVTDEFEGDGTELQYLLLRHCEVETALENILSVIIQNVVFDPPLQVGEIVVVPVEKVPGGFLWVRLSGNLGLIDIGFGENFPLEPVQPSLRCADGSGSQSPSDTQTMSPACKNGVILGGLYPPILAEPPEHERLCSGTFASKGYLCRPLESVDCTKAGERVANSQSDQVDCKQYYTAEELAEFEDPDDAPCPGEDDIVFRRCNFDHMKEPTGMTESGPAVCQVGGWRTDPPTIDESPVQETVDRDLETIAQPFDCSNCAVDFYCDENSQQTFAVTHPKDENGVIPISLPTQSEMPMAYLAMHELVHAQQSCNGDFTFPLQDLQSCCAVEYPAYLAQCNAIAEDGNFLGTDITIARCAALLTDMSCIQFGVCSLRTEDSDGDGQKNADEVACGSNPNDSGSKATDADGDHIPDCRDDNDDEINISDDVEKIIEAAKKNKADVATTCNAAIRDIDGGRDVRSSMIRNSLPLVCSPECMAKYPNTIGNNACYIGQCTEQSVETHRIIPGRTTFVANEQTFPWDSNAEFDPFIGSLMKFPPLPFSRFPLYRPGLLARELDLALCQLNGLPMQNPPDRCNFNVIRQLTLRPDTQAEIGAGLIDQATEHQEATADLQALAPTIGARLGNRLYSDYFGRNIESLRLLVEAAEGMMDGISSIDFPGNMCPRIEP